MYLLRKVIIVLLLSYSTLVFSNEPKEDDNNFIITGLVIDETLTKGGHEFYDSFNELFGSLNSNENIVISERNDLYRKVIIVSMNDTVLFESILTPQADRISELVAAAVARVIEVIVQEALISKELQGL
ncbi:MAG: hypothetical protein D0528_01680 [Methylococcales bacterium]|nr:MAG: hypothetical protein D0528_01680 [Methylococcales bacterium]